MKSDLTFALFKTCLDQYDFGPGRRDEAGWCAFRRAANLGIEPDEAISEVMARIEATGGSYNPGKLQSQMRRAFTQAVTENDELNTCVRSPKTIFNPKKLQKVASAVSGVDEAWLTDKSPIAPAAVTSSQFLEALYNPGEKIVLFSQFRSQGQCLFEIGAKLNPAIPAGPEGVWFMSNPVDGYFHPNPRQANKSSRRSEEAVTSWRYLVLENDEANSGEWMACLVQLPLKIAAIYTSGGKSIHALVRLDAESKKDWDAQRDEMKPVLVTLGADPLALTAVRLTRLPGTMRGDKPQELLFLNPDPDGKPIFTK
jgi:hypothetical protein